MADNPVIDNGTLTDYTVAADDVGGLLYQINKLAYGALDTAILVSATNPLPVGSPVATAYTQTNVAQNAASVTLLASNGSRRGGILVNDTTAILYVKFGTPATATTANYKMVAGATLELPQPIYTGIITGIWLAAGAGLALVTEVT